MSLPCKCYKCALYRELQSINDPLCLSVEEKNCEGRDCDSCDFVCDGFVEKLEGGRLGSIRHFVEN